MPTFTTKDYKAALRSRSARTTSTGGFSVKNDNSFIVIFVIAMMVFIFFYGVSAGLDLDEIFFRQRTRSRRRWDFRTFDRRRSLVSRARRRRAV